MCIIALQLATSSVVCKSLKEGNFITLQTKKKLIKINTDSSKKDQIEIEETTNEIKKILGSFETQKKTEDTELKTKEESNKLSLWNLPNFLLDLPFGIKSVSIVEIPETSNTKIESDLPDIVRALEESLESEDSKRIEKRTTTMAHMKAVGAAAAPALFKKHEKGKRHKRQIPGMMGGLGGGMMGGLGGGMMGGLGGGMMGGLGGGMMGGGLGGGMMGGLNGGMMNGGLGGGMGQSQGQNQQGKKKFIEIKKLNAK